MYISSFLTLTLPLLKTRQTFQAYDSCALTCFNSYIKLGAQCAEPSESQAQIACICQDSIYSIESAVCIYTSCGATILNDTAAKHVSNCNANGSPPAVDAQDFITYGEGGTPAISGTSISLPTATTYSISILSETTYSPSTSTGIGSGSGSNNTPTTTKSSVQDSATQTSSSPTTSSSAASNGGSDTLSTAALVGTIVGSVTGAIGSFAVGYFAWKSYKLSKKEKNKEVTEGQPQVVGT